MCIYSSSYLATQMLSQARPTRGTMIDDWLFGAEDGITLRGVFLITSI